MKRNSSMKNRGVKKCAFYLHRSNKKQLAVKNETPWPALYFKFALTTIRKPTTTNQVKQARAAINITIVLHFCWTIISATVKQTSNCLLQNSSFSCYFISEQRSKEGEIKAAIWRTRPQKSNSVLLSRSATHPAQTRKDTARMAQQL